jgi:hypothetical protein
MIDTEMPAKKPTRIGRERNVATTPRRNRRAARHIAPTTRAISDATMARSTDASAGMETTIDVTAAASTVMVAASGPTISILEGPNNA